MSTLEQLLEQQNVLIGELIEMVKGQGQMLKQIKELSKRPKSRQKASQKRIETLEKLSLPLFIRYEGNFIGSISPIRKGYMVTFNEWENYFGCMVLKCKRDRQTEKGYPNHVILTTHLEDQELILSICSDQFKMEVCEEDRIGESRVVYEKEATLISPFSTMPSHPE